MAAWWSTSDEGIVLRVKVMPGARRSEVVDASGDRLRVRVGAPAVEGKANLELERFLAGLFGVRRSAVSVRHGQRGREKTVAIAGVTAPPVLDLRR